MQTPSKSNLSPIEEAVLLKPSPISLNAAEMHVKPMVTFDLAHGTLSSTS